MQRTGRAYEKPSRISQGLVVGLSIAVVVMAGWLAITIMLSHYTTTSAVGDTDMTGAPVYAENVSPGPNEPRMAAPANSAYFEPLPRGYASTTPPRSALPLTSFAEPSPAATRDSRYAPLSIATAVPDVDYRSIPAKEPLRAGPSIEATDAITDLLRLPPPLAPPPYPPPHTAEGRVGAASIPVPRPRPRLEGEDVQASPDLSSFDLLIDRRR